MGYDAGAIVATAELDRTPFSEGLRLVRADGKRLAAERYTATVDADTKDANAKTDQVKEKLRGIGTTRTTARVSADTTDALLKVQPLVDRLAEIRDRVSTARVRLDGDAKASLKLDDLDLKLRRVGLITSRPQVSLVGVERADIQLDDLSAKLAAVNASGGGRGGGIFGSISRAGGNRKLPGVGLLAGAGAVSALAGPVGGLALGGAASLLTPLVAGGAGLTAFALTAKAAYTTVDANLKTLTADQKTYNAATSDKTRAAAQAKEAKFWHDLPPAQQKAVTQLHSLNGEWASFQKKLQPQTLGALSGALGLAKVGLADILPLTKASGNALITLEGQAKKALTDPFWTSFFKDFLPGQAHTAIMTLGVDLGHLATGLGNLTEKFAPLGDTLEHDSKGWTKSFESWTEGTGPGKFVAWVQKNGPIAAKDITQIAKAVGGLAHGLAPVGQIEFKALEPVLVFLGKVGEQHPKVITDLALGYLSLAAGLKAVNVATGIASVGKDIQALIRLFERLRGTAADAALAEDAALTPKGGGGGGLSFLRRGGPAAGAGVGADVAEGAGVGAGVAGGEAAAVGTVGLVPVLGTLAAAIGALVIYEKTAPTVPKSQQLPTIIQHETVGRGGSVVYNPAGQVAATKAAAAQAKYLTSAAHAADVLSVAEAHMGTIAAQVGGKLTGNSKAAQANQAALTSGVNALKAYRDNLISSGTPLGQVQAKVDAYAKSLQAQAIDTYGSKTAVDALLKSLGATPKQVATKMRLLGVAEAESTLRGLKALIDTVQGRHDVLIHAEREGALPGDPQPSVSSPHHSSRSSASSASPSAQPFGLTRASFHSRLGPASIPNPVSHTGSTSPNAPGSSGSGSSGSSHSNAPSKAAVGNALAALANYAGLTFVNDLDGTVSQVRDGIKTLIDRLNSAVRDNYLNSDKTLVKQLRDSRSTLVGLSAQIAVTTKDLATAKSALSSLRSNAAGVRSSTTQSFLGLGDLSQSGATTVGGLLSVDNQQVKIAEAFSRNLAALRKRGLSHEEYKTLEAEGPAAAGNIVALLSTASRGQLKALNSDEGILGRLGRQTGSASANYLYSARIAHEQRDVTQLAGDVHTLVHDRDRTAKALEALVKGGLSDKTTHAKLDHLERAVVAAIGRSAQDTATALNGVAKQAKQNHRARPAGS